MGMVCKPEVDTDSGTCAAVLMLWVLASTHLGMYGRDKYDLQSWLLCCMKVAGALLGFRGCRHQAAMERRLRLNRMKRGAHGQWPHHHSRPAEGAQGIALVQVIKY